MIRKLLGRASDEIGFWKRLTDGLAWLWLIGGSTVFGWLTSLVPALKDRTWLEYAFLGLGITLLVLTVLSFAANSYVRFSRFRSPTPVIVPEQPAVNITHLERGVSWLEEAVSELIEEKLPKIESEISSLKPAATLLKMELLEPRLDQIMKQAEYRKNSYFDAAKTVTTPGALADYRQYLIGVLGEGKKLVDSITDPGEVDIVPMQDFFKTPAADANPHSTFPGMEELQNDEIRHECRKALELYEKGMSLMRSAKSGIISRRELLKNEVLRNS